MKTELTQRIETLKNKFAEVFGNDPQIIVRAPGRVNLIGEHTDYNDGFVLPIAVDRDVLMAASATDEKVINLFSLNFCSSALIDLNDIQSDEKNTWSNYIRGVASELIKKQISLGGANIALEGNVPLGSGLSSSAALEVAAATTFQVMNGFEMTGPEMALLCQSAENNFVGVNCGIMDQFISRLGEEDKALFVDCRTLDYDLVPLHSKGTKYVVVNSLKKRGLVDSEYNARRSQCEEAVKILQNHIPGIKALRDVSSDQLNKFGSELPEVVLKRATHIVSEDERVIKSVEALKNKDLDLFGKLMNESHDSLRDLYEVSCKELDILVDAARKVDGVLGSRMTGAGFGGCTVSLVKDEALDTFMKQVTDEYIKLTGVTPEIYVFSPEAGAGVI